MNEHTVWFCAAGVAGVAGVAGIAGIHGPSGAADDQLIRYPWRIASDTVAMKTTSDIR